MDELINEKIPKKMQTGVKKKTNQNHQYSTVQYINVIVRTRIVTTQDK